MAELLVRVGTQDAALVERVLAGRADRRPSRIVVDAHVASASPRIGAAAAVAGVPYLIDPQTFYLQDHHHPARPWARLPFARPEAMTPADLLRSGAADALVHGVIEYQLAHDATMVIAPYVHIERAGDGWVPVQVALWRATRRYLDAQGIGLPTTAVAALGWRLLERARWPAALDRLQPELAALNPSEVALAASRVDAGAYPEDRLAALVSVVRQLRRTYPLIAWQQGVLGEAAVAAGAAGYESGIGWRERCDLRVAMAQRRRRPDRRGGPRPAYIEPLRRSIPAASVRALAASSSLAAALMCLDSTCCPDGRRSLTQDMREHAIASRLRTLTALVQPDRPAWRWNHLAQVAQDGLELAARINAFGRRGGGSQQVDLSALRATLVLADNRRQTLRRVRVA